MVDTAMMIAGKVFGQYFSAAKQSRSEYRLGNRHVGAHPGPNHHPDEGSFL
jgi:hypothetical protein